VVPDFALINDNLGIEGSHKQSSGYSPELAHWIERLQGRLYRNASRQYEGVADTDSLLDRKVPERERVDTDPAMIYGIVAGCDWRLPGDTQQEAAGPQASTRIKILIAVIADQLEIVRTSDEASLFMELSDRGINE
jgi:hypothetical protein